MLVVSIWLKVINIGESPVEQEASPKKQSGF